MINFLEKEEYNFLKENPRLKDNIILLTYGGSYSYGTNIETSDVDLRGCALNNINDLLGFSNFEQVIDSNTDTTIYSFKKLINLLINCNPNVIEILGCKPEHYFILKPEGKELIKNRKLFLSKKAVNSFGGYAIQQLRRLENAIARDSMPQAQKERHILSAVNRTYEDWKRKTLSYDKGEVSLYTGKAITEGLDRETFVDINLNHFPIRDFKIMLNEISNVVDNYDSLNTRNKKKDEAHLNKHAMHLIRLYLMCIDILEKEDIITYRKKEREMLLDIRAGKYLNEDGTYDAAFFDMVNEYEKRLAYAKENTSLPEKPDINKIEEFVIEVNRKVINNEN